MPNVKLHHLQRDRASVEQRKLKTKFHKPCYTGKDVQKWHLDDNGYCCLNTVFMVVPKTSETSSEELLYLLAILNSKFIGYYWKTHFSDQRRTFPKIKGTYLKQLPIVIPSDKRQKQIRDRLVNLAEQMLAAQQQLRNSISDSERRTREQRVLILDREIDRLVFELYGLTDEEIKVMAGE